MWAKLTRCRQVKALSEGAEEIEEGIAVELQ
jgi:hypothetical protein